LDVKEAKSTAEMATKTAVELGQANKDACTALQDTRRTAIATQKLWKEGNKSRLIQIGMALVVFPEPTPISEIIGAGFIAAGAIQKGIKSQAIYMEDIPKSLKSIFKEVCNEKWTMGL